MSQVNTVGADLAERGLVRAATDITGFGLLGHLASMCRASGVSAEIFARRCPGDQRRNFRVDRTRLCSGRHEAKPQNRERADGLEKDANAQRLLLADAQTSGGLLLCVPPRRLEAVLRLLRIRYTCASSNHPRGHHRSKIASSGERRDRIVAALANQFAMTGHVAFGEVPRR